MKRWGIGIAILLWLATSVAVIGMGDKKVAIVLDVGGSGDQSFNDMALAGARKAATDLGLEVDIINTASAADYLPTIRTLARTGQYDLILTPSPLLANAIAEVSSEFPIQKFCIIDSVVDGDNVMSVAFRKHHMSALIGALGALVAYQYGFGTFGVVLGIETPGQRNVEAGVRFGAAWASKRICAEIDLLYTYTGSFSDLALSKAASEAMLEQGAMGVVGAGGYAGLGVLAAVEEAHDNAGPHGPPFYFGVGENQDYRPHTLASGMKRVDEATCLCIEAVASGTFKGGLTSLGLAGGGVGISGVEELVDFIGFGVDSGSISAEDIYSIIASWAINREYVPAACWALIDELKVGIIEGSIVVPTANTSSEMQAIRDQYPKPTGTSTAKRIGTHRDDVLAGTPADEVFCGLGGDDEFLCNGGGDWVNAGDGNDTVHLGDGDSHVYGEGGDDTIHEGSGGRNCISGGRGNDTVFITKGRRRTGIDSSNPDKETTVSGGEGTDTVELAGSESDWRETEDGPDRRSFVHRETGKRVTLIGVELIRFRG